MEFIFKGNAADFAGQQISLKEVIQARTQQRKRVRQGIKERLSVVEQLQAAKPAELLPPLEPLALAPPTTPRLKRYFNE